MNVFRKVYLYMTGALLATTLAAYYTSITPALLKIMLNPFLLIGLSILTLALVGILSVKIKTLTFGSALAILFAYAILNGVLLSSIFLYYDVGTIALAFGSTVGLFVILTLIAFVTKTDFEKTTPILFAGLLGIIFATIINIFLRSNTLDLIISIIGVLIFTGLTIRDTKKIKQLESSSQLQSKDDQKKIGVMGALMLYLDFLNLFIFLLRIFGRRR